MDKIVQMFQTTNQDIYIYISHYCWIYPIISPSNPIESTIYNIFEPTMVTRWMFHQRKASDLAFLCHPIVGTLTVVNTC